MSRSHLAFPFQYFVMKANQHLSLLQIIKWYFSWCAFHLCIFKLIAWLYSIFVQTKVVWFPFSFVSLFTGKVHILGEGLSFEEWWAWFQRQVLSPWATTWSLVMFLPRHAAFVPTHCLLCFQCLSDTRMSGVFSYVIAGWGQLIVSDAWNHSKILRTLRFVFLPLASTCGLTQLSSNRLKKFLSGHYIFFALAKWPICQETFRILRREIFLFEH